MWLQGGQLYLMTIFSAYNNQTCIWGWNMLYRFMILPLKMQLMGQDLVDRQTDTAVSLSSTMHNHNTVCENIHTLLTKFRFVCPSLTHCTYWWDLHSSHFSDSSMWIPSLLVCIPCNMPFSVNGCTSVFKFKAVVHLKSAGTPKVSVRAEGLVSCLKC